MSETVLRFMLDELQVLRVHCLNSRCGAIVEATVARADHVFKRGFTCPVCGEPFQASKNDREDHLARLIAALEALIHAKDKVRIEFALLKPDQA